MADHDEIRPLTVGVREAALMLSVSQRHVWNLIETGVLPSVRLGGRVLIRVEAMNEKLKELERMPASLIGKGDVE